MEIQLIFALLWPDFVSSHFNAIPVAIFNIKPHGLRVNEEEIKNRSENVC